MTESIAFDRCARLPAPGDNVAIATRRLEAGTVIEHGPRRFALSHTIMEGHRFVLDPIAADGELLSWGLPFGRASRDIEPGEYVCNEKILEVLAGRDIDFSLPAAANFTDHARTWHVDPDTFEAGEQVAASGTGRLFEGFPRPGERGVGTRNFVVVLAATAESSAFAEAVAARFDETSRDHPNIDGVVAVTHTEGGGSTRPNNLDFVLRTLAGFVVHPNVGAVLVVDYGTGAYSGADLERFMTEARYPLDAVLHRFFDIAGGFERELERACDVVGRWLPEVAAMERRPSPVSALRLALQCGGSDAFSGVSGNALAGWVAKELIRHGGSANLAETDELIGAEPYVLANVRDLGTAERFLEKIEIFKERAARHGASAEGNPSGGNNYRGLYNIALKSIGAARKKDPEVRLDYVLDYGERMDGGGYYFMDSPGNDLESIAGQVASGSNVILFITGNGSITNFPFVPTLKFVTTTGRFDMLRNEMDVNAGRYNDGVPMPELGAETFELALRVASGERSKGELAGHAQVQVWRDWPIGEGGSAARASDSRPRDGAPLAVVNDEPCHLEVELFAGARGPAGAQLGLVMPTSLCSGQVARLIARHLNDTQQGAGVSSFVSLVHTEGCGSVNAEEHFLQTLVGHLQHPFVKRAVLLEHGCERTHNDAIRLHLEGEGLDTSRFGWASVQLDGGIESVRDKVSGWFRDALAGETLGDRSTAVNPGVVVAVGAFGEPGEVGACALARLARRLVAGGATVVVPENATVARLDAFRRELLADGTDWRPTLDYGAPAGSPGLHVMASPTTSAVETVTGLGGTGAQAMVVLVGRTPVQGHPMVPVLQLSDRPEAVDRYRDDLDLVLEPAEAADSLVERLRERLAATLSGRYTPRMSARGVANFQLTRGLIGLSL